MKEKHKVSKERLKRFEFTPVNEVKVSLASRPELGNRLKEDLEGALREEGVVIDESFKQQISDQWRAQIKADVRDVVARSPDAEDWYLKRIVEGKPIKIRVEVDRTTKRHTKRLKRE